MDEKYRKARSTSIEDKARIVSTKLRLGQIDLERIILAARLGNPVAQGITGVKQDLVFEDFIEDEGEMLYTLLSEQEFALLILDIIERVPEKSGFCWRNRDVKGNLINNIKKQSIALARKAIKQNNLEVFNKAVIKVEPLEYVRISVGEGLYWIIWSAINNLEEHFRLRNVMLEGDTLEEHEAYEVQVLPELLRRISQQVTELSKDEGLERDYQGSRFGDYLMGIA